MSARRFQFSTLDLILATLVIAMMCGLLALVQMPLAGWITSLAVVSVFVVADVLLLTRVAPGSPIRITVARFIAFHATGYGVASLACLAAALLAIKSPPPGSAWDLTGALRGITIVYYLLVASAFSAIAFLASLVALRKFIPARWLAFINLPGTLLFCSFVADIIRGLQQES